MRLRVKWSFVLTYMYGRNDLLLHKVLGLENPYNLKVNIYSALQFLYCFQPRKHIGNIENGERQRNIKSKMLAY